MSTEPPPETPFPLSAVERELPKGKAGRSISIRATFVAFMAGVVLTAIVYHNLIIESKNATIERLERRSPQADEKLIESLKADLKRYQDSYGDRLAHEWEPLTEEQVIEWAAALAPHKIASISVVWGQDVDAGRFFRSLQAVGERIGVKVEATGGNAGGPGLQIYLPKEHPLREALSSLCNKSGIRLQVLDGNPQPQIELFIYIGPKPLKSR